MDFDTDGTVDIVAGTYTEDIVWFKGLGGGKFGAKQAVKYSGTQEENYACSPALADWNGDGILDMIVGYIAGNVRIYYGLVSTHGPLLDAGRDMTAAGKPIEASDGGPYIVDWDGDGRLDLLLGDGEGSVRFFARKADGSLAAGVDLIGPSDDGYGNAKRDPKNASLPAKRRPGMRTKLCATDWNGDGKLDLLVGDYLSLAPVTKTLTEAEEAEVERLDARTEEVTTEMSELSAKIEADALKALGVKSRNELTPEKQNAYFEKLTELMQADPAYKKITEEYSAIFMRIGELRGSATNHGYVWVYLRQ